MGINLSNLFGKLNDNTVIQGVNDIKGQLQQSALKTDGAGVEMLKNMLAGDTFTGKIISIDDNNAVIALNNGKLVNAQLTAGADIITGQNVTFMVEKNNKNSISIKPLQVDDQQLIMAGKALEAAGYAETKANLALVAGLIDQGMPIDAGTISEMVRMCAKHPGVSADTIAGLIKLDIPVTSENIMQYEAYKSYEHSIMNNLEDLTKQLSDYMNNILNSGNGEINDFVRGMEVLSGLSDIFYNTDGYSVEAGNINSVLNENEAVRLADILNKISGDEAAGDNVKKLAAGMAERLNNGELATKDALAGLAELLKSDSRYSEEFKELFANEGFNRLIRQMVDDTMKLTPADVGEADGIRKYYKRVRSMLDNAGHAMENVAEAQNFNKSMDSIKANIDFMNDLNKNMIYFQMPVKLKGQDANGELYVFTNKKALAVNQENVSALLHLDMENLGPMDIYVKLAGKNVTTNFCLENEEMLDFINLHIDKLNARLEELGYSTRFEMNVSDEASRFVTPVNTNQAGGTEALTQYILDVKA